MKFVKYIKKQDSGWKQQPSYSGETSINLSNEICDFLSYGLISEGQEQDVCFLIYKEDFIEALQFIRSQCPLYRTTSRTFKKIDVEDTIFMRLEKYIDIFFGEDQIKEYTAILYNRNDKRIYLKGLKHDGFTIRDFLVEDTTIMTIEETDGIFSLRLSNEIYEP